MTDTSEITTTKNYTITKDAQYKPGSADARRIAAALTKEFKTKYFGDNVAQISFNFYWSDKKMILVEMPGYFPTSAFRCLYDLMNDPKNPIEWEPVGESTIAVFPRHIN